MTIWAIWGSCKVTPLADVPAGETVRWWTVEGSESWQPGQPPGTSATVTTKKPKQATNPPGLADGAGLFNLIGSVK
jgi:hypothetical protein